MAAADWRAFCADRDDALRSLKRSKICAFLKVWGLEPPPAKGFWKWVHISRVFNEGLTEEERMVSVEWLDEHGYIPQNAVERERDRIRESGRRPVSGDDVSRGEDLPRILDGSGDWMRRTGDSEEEGATPDPE